MGDQFKSQVSREVQLALKLVSNSVYSCCQPGIGMMGASTTLTLWPVLSVKIVFFSSACCNNVFIKNVGNKRKELLLLLSAKESQRVVHQIAIYSAHFARAMVEMSKL
jgi:hypothetical protein